MTKEEIFTALTEKAADTYRRKNADYGDSFTKTRELIPNAILVRLHDKLNRVTSLMLKGDQMVSDESVEDTLLDMANYCLMELTERVYERQPDCNIQSLESCIYLKDGCCMRQKDMPVCSPGYCPAAKTHK